MPWGNPPSSIHMKRKEKEMATVSYKAAVDVKP